MANINSITIEIEVRYLQRYKAKADEALSYIVNCKDMKGFSLERAQKYALIALNTGAHEGDLTPVVADAEKMRR